MPKRLMHLQNKSTKYNIKNTSTCVGLGSYWGEVLDVLQEIIPVYDKVNSYISLGKDSEHRNSCLLYTSPSPRDGLLSRMPSSA